MNLLGRDPRTPSPAPSRACVILLAIALSIPAAAAPKRATSVLPAKQPVEAPARAPTPAPTPESEEPPAAMAVDTSVGELVPAGQAPAPAPAAPTPKPAPINQQRPGTKILTRAVAEVSDRVVTSREVRINDAVEQAITGKPSVPEGFRVLDGNERSFPVDVTRVLDEWIVFLEAKTLSNQPPSRGDVSNGIRQVLERWGNKPAWSELEVSSDELREIVERKLIAKDFERLKSDPQMAPVSDEDALAYYRKNRLRFGSLPFSSFKDNIKAFLTKQQTERRVSEWREVLRRKYKVRNFIAG